MQSLYSGLGNSMPKHSRKVGTAGVALKRAREIKKLSLRKVAGSSGITATYLKKLEDGQVAEPSPNILYDLSSTLGISYPDLMRLAGYIVPRGSKGDDSSSDALSVALQSANLTDAEMDHMIEYLKFIKKTDT